MEITDKELRTSPIHTLFRRYFYPTLGGMLAVSLVTVTDGIFVGNGIGADGVAAVNLVWAPLMLFIGLGLMLGMGSSVAASIALAKGDVITAKRHVTQSMIVGFLAVSFVVSVMFISPAATVRILGASDTLTGVSIEYLVYILPGFLFDIFAMIGLFVLRVDGNPKLAMWCTLLRALVNIILDYILIFPLGMGIKGAAIATSLSYVVGAAVVLVYLTGYARSLRLLNPINPASWKGWLNNLWLQCKIGVSGMLGEGVMALTMFLGNIMTMKYLGDAGVGAFGLICYYLPFVFLVGNSIAQGAQPIISFNYGYGDLQRVKSTERVAIKTAIISGLIMGALFLLGRYPLTDIFLSVESTAGNIAVSAFPYYALCAVPYIFNIASIGYFQSIGKAAPSIVFSLLRGPVFLIPSYLLLPTAMGVTGIWIALGVSELMTAVCICAYYWKHHK